MIIINKYLFYDILKKQLKNDSSMLCYTFIFIALHFFIMSVVHFSSIFAFQRGSSELILKLRTQPSLLSCERATFHIMQSSVGETGLLHGMGLKLASIANLSCTMSNSGTHRYAFCCLLGT